MLRQRTDPPFMRSLGRFMPMVDKRSRRCAGSWLMHEQCAWPCESPRLWPSKVPALMERGDHVSTRNIDVTAAEAVTRTAPPPLDPCGAIAKP